jgi:uncharacterized protein YeaO (DUF488 family)
MIRLKRAYDPPEDSDGRRFLVDRLWPRGVKKEALQVEGWLREIAPSEALRRWYGHEGDRWTEFERRYRAELDQKEEFLRPLLDAARQGDITLVFAKRDVQHNNAAVLKAYLEERLHPGQAEA